MVELGDPELTIIVAQPAVLGAGFPGLGDLVDHGLMLGVQVPLACRQGGVIDPCIAQGRQLAPALCQRVGHRLGDLDQRGPLADEVRGVGRIAPFLRVEQPLGCYLDARAAFPTTPSSITTRSGRNGRGANIRSWAATRMSRPSWRLMVSSWSR